jgi:hypothetical protein
MGGGVYAHRYTHGGPPRPHLIVQCGIVPTTISEVGIGKVSNVDWLYGRPMQ